jgi:hypothetical protein
MAILWAESRRTTKGVSIMRRTILLATVVPFVSAFLGGFVAFSLASPPMATAQDVQSNVVRASAFELVGAVGADGTVIGRLSSGVGGGNLTLFTVNGTRRTSLSAATGMTKWLGPDGETIGLRVGISTNPDPDIPFNGLLLGPGGSISMLPTP